TGEFYMDFHTFPPCLLTRRMIQCPRGPVGMLNRSPQPSSVVVHWRGRFYSVSFLISSKIGYSFESVAYFFSKDFSSERADSSRAAICSSLFTTTSIGA